MLLVLFNDTCKEKLCFSQFSHSHKNTELPCSYYYDSVQKFTERQGWLLLTFFISLDNQLSSINSISHINKKYICLNKMFHGIDRK